MANKPLVAIYGNSDSGKTELVVDLVEEFSGEGVGVCTIKHSPRELSLDEEGKDTWKHKNAGSRFTVLATEVETSFLVPRGMELEEVEEILNKIDGFDLIIAEGYKDADVPKVAVGDIDPRDGTLHEYDGDFTELKRKINELISLKGVEDELPGLDCGRCGYEGCEELSKAVLEGKVELSECEVREQRRVNLEVNGKDVALEYFPARFIEGGLKGMLGALKGVDDEINRISLEIRD